jgi:hypothetical protein
MTAKLEHQVAGLRGAFEGMDVELKGAIATLRAELAKTRAYAPVPRPALVLGEDGEPTAESMAALRASKAFVCFSDLTVVAQAMGEEIDSHAKRIGALEARRLDVFGNVLKRVDALESRRVLTYEGIWSAQEEYRPGSATTHGGSLWVAETAPMIGDRPGSDGSCWRLAIKRGSAER